ncbi:DNA polymerase phi-domain-containing protein [Piptocephalis cylindrospora]|uniref:DNA polymerase phi-domain-containing protein n=1 Tax=Piptocephalis cylindrospora TaxID=1907219 RepID=A0A4P9Y370_9FUNG|nr:DNA polymerase phi-domain-containing protein [Piptocephalis cylindrospora]|eukprot:RKP13124.1 DNA polymerase phi-domain-containing protein [Piptocephalis cylindrospora]
MPGPLPVKPTPTPASVKTMSTGASTTLPLYWDLASMEASKRLGAATSLIRQLQDFQTAFTQGLSEKDVTKRPSLTLETLDLYCAKDVAYALRRLFRGLASSREGARQGFSLALTELLTSLDFVTIPFLLELLESSTEISSGSSGQEERDALFGRVFGLMCIVQAGIPARSFAEGKPDLEMLFTMAARLSRAKPYLREPTAQAILQLVPQIPPSTHPRALEKLAAIMFSTETKTPESLQLALTIQETAPDINIYRYFSGWESGDLLQAGNLPMLAEILQESSSTDPALYSTWHPQLHTVWHTLLGLYFPEPRRSTLCPFPDLWVEAVDKGLFGASISPEHKYWGFELLEAALNAIPAPYLSSLLTPNILRTFVGCLSGPSDQPLAKRARQSLSRLVELAGRSQEGRLALSTALTGPHGHRDFDRVTRTRTVESLLSARDGKDMNGYFEYLSGLFTSAAATHAEEGMRRQKWTVDQMLGLVRNPKNPRSNDLTRKLIQFLLQHIMDTKETGGVREMCTERLFSLLTDLATSPPPVAGEEKGTVRGKKFHGRLEAKEGSSLWLEEVVWMVWGMLGEPKGVSTGKAVRRSVRKGGNRGSPEATGTTSQMLEETGAEAKEALALARAEAEGLAGRIGSMEAGEKQGQLDSLYQLLLHEWLLLFMLHGISEEEGVAAIQDLKGCLDRLHPEEDKKKKRGAAGAKKGKATGKEEEEGAEEPEAISVLVDLVLSFLSRATHLQRTLAEQALVSHAPLVTDGAIELMLAVLEEGDEETGGHDNDEEEEEEEEEMEEEMEEEESLEEEEESEDDGDESDEDEEDNSPVDPEFQARIEAALGEARASEDAESDGSVDDEGMKGFDGALEEVFRQRKLAKSSKSGVVEARRHLRLRVCGMLEAYGKAVSARELTAWSAVVPLLRRAGSGGQVGERCTSVVREGWVKAKGPGVKVTAGGEEEEKVIGWMKDVSRVARSRGDRTLTKLCGMVWRGLGRMVPLARVEELGREGLKRFLTGKDGRGGGREGGFWEVVVMTHGGGASGKETGAEAGGLPWAILTLVNFGCRAGQVRDGYTMSEAWRWLGSLGQSGLQARDVGGSEWEELVSGIGGGLGELLEGVATGGKSVVGGVIPTGERLKAIMKRAVGLVKRLGRLDAGSGVLLEAAGLTTDRVECAVSGLDKEWMRMQGRQLLGVLQGSVSGGGGKKKGGNSSKGSAPPPSQGSQLRSGEQEEGGEGG